MKLQTKPILVKDEAIPRDTLERMIETVIRVSPVPLTAGAILRLIERNIGSNFASRSTVQRIADKLADTGAVNVERKMVEKNGFLIEARHYHKKRECL